MANPNQGPANGADALESARNYRRRLVLGFSLFMIFFVFYMGAAVIQTPVCRTLASLPCLGMPLGLFLSMMIFPVSWAIIVVFFLKWR